MIFDISQVTRAKSDQLNAEDLLGGPITVTISDVYQYNDPQQPVGCEIGNGHQPWKPCLTVRRVLMNLWGKYSDDWVGKSVTLYCDQDVTYGRDKTGGIRVSHASGIDSERSVTVTERRGKRKPVVIKPLQLPAYPPEDFEKNKGQWSQLVSEGKYTPHQIIQGCQQKGLLTEQQKAEILNMAQPEPQQSEDEDM